MTKPIHGTMGLSKHQVEENQNEKKKLTDQKMSELTTDTIKQEGPWALYRSPESLS